MAAAMTGAGNEHWIDTMAGEMSAAQAEVFRRLVDVLRERS
ncbi:hypothetical protein GCM10027610_089400 [Dactylosporangium cerinum]